MEFDLGCLAGAAALGVLGLAGYGVSRLLRRSKPPLLSVEGVATLDPYDWWVELPALRPHSAWSQHIRLVEAGVIHLPA